MADSAILNAKKSLGQVMTPNYIVEIMARNLTLLNKKILEPGCGEGAFLVYLAKKYCAEFLEKNSDLAQLKAHLEQNLIGVEIDGELLAKCRANLDSAVAEFGLKSVAWKLLNCDFLTAYAQFRGQMDIVIGNPPYIRIHNLSQGARNLTKGGMGDLYLIFFDLGFECLKGEGKLIFITPSSWLNSKAGASLRAKIAHSQNLVKIIDFAHEKVFKNITTYALISFFQKGIKRDFITLCDDAESSGKNAESSCAESSGKNAESSCAESRKIPYKNLFLENGELYLGEAQEILKCKPLPVKNGFATLCDEFFIGDFVGLDYPKIKILKASNGAWAECIYPYNQNGEFVAPKGAVLERYKAFEARLKNRDLRGANFMAFGRTQGLKDTYKRKIAFNTLIKNIKDIKIYEVPKGQGVYSGLYLVSEVPLSEFERVLKTSEFLSYIKSLRKYKNGGYYAFNSADLGRYLAWKMS